MEFPVYVRIHYSPGILYSNTNFIFQIHRIKIKIYKTSLAHFFLAYFIIYAFSICIFSEIHRYGLLYGFSYTFFPQISTEIGPQISIEN